VLTHGRSLTELFPSISYYNHLSENYLTNQANLYHDDDDDDDDIIIIIIIIIISTGLYSPYRTLAFLNGLLDPQTFGRTP
jgi:hypothetical protein